MGQITSPEVQQAHLVKSETIQLAHQSFAHSIIHSPAHSTNTYQVPYIRGIMSNMKMNNS